MQIKDLEGLKTILFERATLTLGTKKFDDIIGKNPFALLS